MDCRKAEGTVSDITKKILSIDPAGDDDPQDTDTMPGNLDAIDAVIPLRRMTRAPEPEFRPMVQLVEPIGYEKEDNELADTSATFRPIRELDISFEDADDLSDAPEASNPQTIEPGPIQPSTPVERPSLSDMASVAPAAAFTEPSMTRTGIGWTGLVFTLLTGLSVAALVVAYLGAAETFTPLGLAALILAASVPMIAVVTFWASLRAFGESRAETLRLAALADRLTRADETVANDVARLSSSIRRELALVDSRLAQTRSEMETLSAVLQRQSTETDAMARNITERTDAIARNAKTQRDAMAATSAEVDTGLQGLSETVGASSQALKDAADTTAAHLSEASAKLGQSLEAASGQSDTIARTTQEASQIIAEAETRLATLANDLKAQADAMETVFEARAQQLDGLLSRLSAEKTDTDRALYRQSDLLSAVDAQIEMTEARLTALIDNSREVQDQLTARLSDIDSTLDSADRRSRAFTADIADRVSDSVAQTRRELSIMESEIRSLQSRMDESRDNGFSAAAQTSQPTSKSIAHIQAPSEPDPHDLSIPELSQEADDALEDLRPSLTRNLVAEADPDIVTRPGMIPASPSIDPIRPPDMGTTFPPVGTDAPAPPSDWRWRDMLGSIEPIPQGDAEGWPTQLQIRPSKAEDSVPTQPVGDQVQPAPRPVDRPGPGVPLSRPAFVPAPDAAQGSEVVARLCEVQLAPSSLVDDALVQLAVDTRQSGGEAAQSKALFSALNAPVIHLRGVLAADLEFRLRAESFRRNFDQYLSAQPDRLQQIATLSTASGRAYLLCAAALTAG
ncbi:MAG: hypothetical protein WBG08_03450 [Litorimonas sp.]